MRTPRAAAVAGIAFSVLFTVALVLVRLSLPSDPEGADDWLTEGGKRDAVILALNGIIPWVELIFPAWVFVVSAHILVVSWRSGATSTAAEV